MNPRQKNWTVTAATGAQASARFNIHFRETPETSGLPALWALKRRERAPFWTAPAERSGDGAFVCNRNFQSGVALRLPPQSKFAAIIRRLTSLDNRRRRINASQRLFKLT
jgi:hypothetical protein